MHQAARRSDAFQEWLKSPDGQKCAEYPVHGGTYLINRLWWAFQAGREAGRKERSESEEVGT